MKLIQDVNLIWKKDKVHEQAISYTDEGTNLSFELEDTSFWFQHRNNIILSITKRLPFHGDFADIGGGNGLQAAFLKKYYAGKKIVLIEPSYQGCMNAKKRGVEGIYNMTFQYFPFEAENIGGVGLFDVIEHIENDVAFLTDLQAKLKIGTRIYITTPAHKWLWSANDNSAGHFRRYTLEDYESLAEKCGLKIIYKSYFFTYLIPLIGLFRSIPYRLGLVAERNKEQTRSEHSTSSLMKKCLRYLNTKEVKTVRNSKMLFGASCLIVLEK